MLLSFIFCLYLYHFICRHRLADIFLFYLVLSADFLVGWRTFSCFLLFYLPTFCEPGRHILYFHAFVCHRWLYTGRHIFYFHAFVCLRWLCPADKLFTFMLLSASAG